MIRCIAMCCLFFGGVSASSAALYAINNVAFGPGDTLYADQNNNRMNGGIVTIGYFNAGFDVAAAVNSNNIGALLANFTVKVSGVPGSFSTSFNGSFAGYVEDAPFDDVSIPIGDSLVGRTLYSFVGNGTSLNLSSAHALVDIGVLQPDDPNENTYSSNPTGRPVLIGSNGTFIGNAGGGVGTYNTLILEVVPEPSVALLGGLGVLGLVARRRRN